MVSMGFESPRFLMTCGTVFFRRVQRLYFHLFKDTSLDFFLISIVLVIDCSRVRQLVAVRIKINCPMSMKMYPDLGGRICSTISISRFLEFWFAKKATSGNMQVLIVH